MSVHFLPDAQAELDDAISYYDSKVEGLGDRFEAAVRAALTRIEDLPETWPMVSPKSRRCLVKRFPYGVIYQLYRGEIYVLAIAHLHRRPDYWRWRELK